MDGGGLTRIYWLGRRALTAPERDRLLALHGRDALLVHEPAALDDAFDLRLAVRARPDGPVYADPSPAAAVGAALAGCEFGIVETVGGHVRVWRVADGALRRLWPPPAAVPAAPADVEPSCRPPGAPAA